MATELTAEERLEGVLACAEEVVYHFQCWARTTDKGNEAHHLIELFNRISDLKSWDPTYDYETGTVAWEREDGEYA